MGLGCNVFFSSSFNHKRLFHSGRVCIGAHFLKKSPWIETHWPQFSFLVFFTFFFRFRLIKNRGGVAWGGRRKKKKKKVGSRTPILEPYHPNTLTSNHWAKRLPWVIILDHHFTLVPKNTLTTIILEMMTIILSLPSLFCLKMGQKASFHTMMASFCSKWWQHFTCRHTTLWISRARTQ